MQGSTLNKGTTRHRIEQGRTRYWIGWLLRLIAAGLLLIVIGIGVIYVAWDYLPDNIAFRIHSLQSRFLPQSPPPEAVPTPSGVTNPNDTLAALTIASPTPLPSATPEPTATPAPTEAVEAAATEIVPTATIPATATPEPTATPAPLHQVAAPAAQLAGVRHEYQGWNNCGPTTLAMLLSFFGRPETQRDTAPFLKPDREDKNVSPNELAAYGEYIGYRSRVVVGMDVPLLKTFLTNQVPVIVETWYIPEPEDEMGHYLLFTGYTGETLSFFDSYKGPNVTKDAATFDALWKVFNRTAVLVYPPEQEPLVNSILGDLADPATQIDRATQIAYAEASANPQDKFAWFNLGSSLMMGGDSANAVQAFDTARSLKLPWRMMWYQFGPYQAYYEQGRYDEVVALANATLANADNLEESFYWRGRAQAALGNTDAARQDFETALRLNSNFAPARQELGG